jgi:hypothetical protein
LNRAIQGRVALNGRGHRCETYRARYSTGVMQRLSENPYSASAVQSMIGN